MNDNTVTEEISLKQKIFKIIFNFQVLIKYSAEVYYKVKSYCDIFITQ